MKGISWPRTNKRIDPSGEYEDEPLESLQIEGDDGDVRIVGHESKEKRKGISFEVRLYHADLLKMLVQQGRGDMRFVKQMQAELLRVEAEHLKRESKA